MGAGDIIYFMIAVPKRPFSFVPSSVPGSNAPGITFAKLDRNGQLLSAIDVTANIVPWTVDGSVQLSAAQPVVAEDGVIVVGSLLSGGVAIKFAK